MDIPFYYSFKEFETNYNSDLQNWIKDFPDATEKDFLGELKELYEPFVRWSGKYHFKPKIRISYEYDGYTEYADITINEVAEYAEKKIIVHCKDIGTIENVDTENYIFEESINPLDYWEDSNKYYSNETIHFEDKQFNYLKYFFTYLGFLGFQLDEKKYKNFSFSVVKIAEWIDEEIKNTRSKKVKETIPVQPISITDIYKPGLSQFYKSVKKENNLVGNIYRNVESENNKLLSDKSNTELNQHKTKFNIEFRYLISKFNDFFSNLYDYLEPKINTEKRNLQDYKDARENNLNSLEIEIENRFTNLNNFLLQLGIYRSENNFVDAYNLRDYYKSMTGLYKKFLEDYGMEIIKTPFKEKFDNLISSIETSLDTDELKFINQLQNNNNNPTKTDALENDFSDNEPKERLIILEKLKIIDFIKSIQTSPEKISQTAEILSAITGIKSSTLYTYLRPMISPNADYNDKNNPYKNNENVLNANKIIQKFKIKNTNADN